MPTPSSVLPGATLDEEWSPTLTPPPPAAAPQLPPPPPEPESLERAGITAAELEALVLKTLLAKGATAGAQVADSVCVNRRLVDETLGLLREELLVAIKSSIGVNDFVYQLTDAGHARAQRHAEQCTYVGAAPVTLEAYKNAIRRQSIQSSRISLRQLAQSLGDLTLRPELVSQVTQAINDGRGMFLFGPPGNGKTSLAERIVDAFGQHLWIPRMISIDGDLVRLYDATCHQAVDSPRLAVAKYDRRWVLIRRPTVVVGGELTLEQLDASYLPASGISEAPVQLKANGGALVIDDFGRQRASSTEILNRLIVPLEKQFDFLNLASGRQAQTPFELLFVLSTNLAPRELVDEAFLRRIPYKIKVEGPTEDEFRSLMHAVAQATGLELAPGVVEYLLKDHLLAQGRVPRYCHPRDLLRQAKTYCDVHDLPMTVDREAINVAVRNYFVTV